MPQPEGMDDWEYAQEWLRFSEMDLSSANFLTGHWPLPVEIICFHCQQSAEKALKGVLVLNNTTPPKIHELDKLFNLCKPFVSGIDTIWDSCNTLNQYSVMPRYPDEIQISEGAMRRALTSAAAVLDFVRPLYAKPDDAGDKPKQD